jgi:hypothetical protein
MSNELNPAVSPVAVDPPPRPTAGQRRLPVAALFNTTALPTTTVLATATGPKLPPFVGD